MGIPWRTFLGILLVASSVGIWVYTPWWVWSVGVAIAALGMFTFGSYLSLALLGTAGLILLFGYVVQPDAVTLLDLLDP